MPANVTVTRVIAELDRLYGRRDALAAKIEAALLAHRFGELLLSLPGIGPRASKAFEAETRAEASLTMRRSPPRHAAAT